MKRRTLFILLLALLLVASGCGPGSGDRVLVAKYIYDADITNPERQDVVVFRYPERPIENGVPTNYIKRLLGLAGETLAIFFGQIFVYDGDYFVNKYKEDRDPTKVNPNELWEPSFTHRNDEEAQQFFKEGKFSIVHKKPAVMMALRRLVYDNDHQAKSLEGIIPPRWVAVEGEGWTTSDNRSFSSKENTNLTWLRYRHLVPPNHWEQSDLEIIKRQKHEPQLITDFSGYNSYEPSIQGLPSNQTPNWVGDLMLECEVKVEEPKGEFRLELSQGVNRFQARFDLPSGTCTLVRLGEKGKEEVLDSKPTSINRAGTYQVRFANFDERLTVWVNRDLPFGDGKTYKSPWHFDSKADRYLGAGPTANDLEPASLASKDAKIQVHHLKLFRDTYYTTGETGDIHFPNDPTEMARNLSTPSEWEMLYRRPPLTTMFVQPGHYLCLGDNSQASSDSRMWGLVPQRLLLGRALVVYYPFGRAGIIH